MNIRYDPETDILSIVFRDAPVEESDEEKPGVVLDYDAQGRVVAIEIRRASTAVDAPATVSLSLGAGHGNAA